MTAFALLLVIYIDCKTVCPLQIDPATSTWTITGQVTETCRRCASDSVDRLRKVGP